MVFSETKKSDESYLLKEEEIDGNGLSMTKDFIWTWSLHEGENYFVGQTQDEKV